MKEEIRKREKNEQTKQNINKRLTEERKKKTLIKEIN